MFRIDSPGATAGNLFTEGNPQQGIPATEVSSDWLNDTVQEELVQVVEAAGITLNKTDNTQLLQALNALIQTGGSVQTKVAIANAQGSAADVTGLVYDKTNIKAVRIEFEVYRQTDSQNVTEMGVIMLSHNTSTDSWEISQSSSFDDSGCVFSVTSAGQLQYTSDDLTGANYAGFIRVAGITQFNQ